MTIRFDQSLPRLVEIVFKQFGEELLGRSIFVRDVRGRLSVILADHINEEKLVLADAEIRQELGGYARSDLAVRDIEGIGSKRLLEEGQSVAPLVVSRHKIHLLDRRSIGADWLAPPARTATGVPRIVFVSLKGGVGRSTALSVVAAHLSRRGRRVLAVDFDLEAPGLGTMLLNERELPTYGTLDYLIENGLSGVDDEFVADLTGDSFIGAGGGRVSIVPAIGKSTIENPQNTLDKLARAYLEDPSNDGSTITLSEQFREMIERFERTGAYDVVLVDARAGLHETSAAAILGLGADVLLFGIDHPQTFLGYRLLMAHLARFRVDPNDDWRDRLTFVNAKASDSYQSRKEAEENFVALYDLIAPPAEPEPPEASLTANDFDVRWDENANDETDFKSFEPPPIIHISDDSRYRDFNPLRDNTLLDSATYATTFVNLLEYTDAIIDHKASEAP